jgi:hypothetical protein
MKMRRFEYLNLQRFGRGIHFARPLESKIRDVIKDLLLEVVWHKERR